jgi:hypothetical protein
LWRACWAASSFVPNVNSMNAAGMREFCSGGAGESSAGQTGGFPCGLTSGAANLSYDWVDGRGSQQKEPSRIGVARGLLPARSRIALRAAGGRSHCRAPARLLCFRRLPDAGAPSSSSSASCSSSEYGVPSRVERTGRLLAELLRWHRQSLRQCPCVCAADGGRNRYLGTDRGPCERRTTRRAAPVCRSPFPTSSRVTFFVLSIRVSEPSSLTVATDCAARAITH